jgi:hypothetical protein
MALHHEKISSGQSRLTGQTIQKTIGRLQNELKKQN